MSLSEFLKKKAVALETKQASMFTRDIPKLKKYLAHFKAPKDLTARAYYQYRCQTKLKGGFLGFCLNLASFPLLCYYWLIASKQAPEQVTPVQAVFIRDGKPENIMPRCLRDEFETLECDPVEGAWLTKEDKRFLRRLWRRYPFSWHFVLKVLIKVMRYRYFLAAYQPKALVVCNEYSFTSSALTLFCRENGVELVNVMHGEKTFDLRDTFFAFDRCFVWNEFYRDLFLSLRAEPTQFRIAVPDSLIFTERGGEKSFDYSYYLGNEDGEVLRTIVEAMVRLSRAGYNVAIRPHPRYSDIAHIKEYAEGTNIEIEDTSALTIERSVLRTRYAVSLFSTVLNQAYHNGVGVVIDDVSNPPFYAKLGELGFTMLSVEHTLLSQLLERS